MLYPQLFKTLEEARWAINDVPWEAHAAAKEWYARIKSRPSFRQILADHVPGAPPPKHYADLDF